MHGPSTVPVGQTELAAYFLTSRAWQLHWLLHNSCPCIERLLEARRAAWTVHVLFTMLSQWQNIQTTTWPKSAVQP